ncbi:glycosyltransferase [Methylobacterium planeticum]|uniref:Glycosyltransferase family 4 protein n=1 Tax=Methylobacterium planeticum TaxID=2615211 RepID=A0A6N6MU04_9HYPH|nr:glycosyltransferase [Methylobacterium planeticum]KAB1075338.1 glycosyltransferase family 4 protein [Methylobacterium planeticum]
MIRSVMEETAPMRVAAARRVVIVSNLFPPVVIGGAEIVAHRQAKALAARGYDVAVFAGGLPEAGAEPGSLTLEMEDGFPVYRLILNSLAPAENFHCSANAERFLSVLAAHQPELVHFHNLAGLGFNLIPTAKAFGARVVVTLHDHAGLCFKSTLLRDDGSLCDDIEECAVCLPAIDAPDGTRLPIRLRRDYTAWCLSQADHLLSPSAYLAGALAASGVVTRPVEHLSNGISGERVRVRPKPAPEPVAFTCFSYLGEHKGIPTLLAAAEMLAGDRDLEGRWHLTIAGHGHLADALSRDIAAGRFRGAVAFAGRLAHEQALDRLAETHVVVLASHWPENEPVTLLEAIASGTAQIATRIGGNPDLVDEESSGVLVTPGDAASLALAMRRYIDDPELASAHGAYNAARRDRFDESRTIERLVGLYDLLAGPETAAEAADEILVICGGRVGSRERALQLQVLLHRFHLVEDKVRRVRFVWQGWADARVWREARMLWLWGEADEAELPLVARALRADIPVLAPRSSAQVSAAAAQDVDPYDTLLDALGALAALQDVPAPARSTTGRGPGAARFLNALAPAESFQLPVRAPA